jgi:alpha-tubulin suppressor-like RCC1 family protein
MRAGTVRCWGSNFFGNLGNGRTDLASLPVDVLGLSNVSRLSVGGQSLHACALRSDRTVWCWGSNSDGQLGIGDIENRSIPVQVVGLMDAVQVSVGFQHSCALRASGAIVCWGKGDDGRLGDGGSARQTRPVTAAVTDAVAVFAGYAHTCALRRDGGAVCWGNNEFGQLGDGSTRDSAVPTAVRAP